MTDLTPSQIDAAARARVLRALSHIEAAEHNLSEAAQEISALLGWIRTYEAIRRKAEIVHDLCRRVRDTLHDAKGNISLDEFGLEAIRKGGGK